MGSTIQARRLPEILEFEDDEGTFEAGIYDAAKYTRHQARRAWAKANDVAWPTPKGERHQLHTNGVYIRPAPDDMWLLSTEPQLGAHKVWAIRISWLSDDDIREAEEEIAAAIQAFENGEVADVIDYLRPLYRQQRRMEGTRDADQEA